MTKDECLQFVRNCAHHLRSPSCSLAYALLTLFSCLAIALAIARDGSSGGVIRTAVVTESGIERDMIPGDKLPRFWQG